MVTAESMVELVTGTNINGAFTVLNTSPTKAFGEDHVLNAFAFSTLRQWLHSCYVENVAELPVTVSHSRESSVRSAPQVDELTERVRDAVVDYCCRIIEQGTSKSEGNRSDSVSQIDVRLVAGSLNEVLRLLSTLCTMDSTLTARRYYAQL